MKNKQKILLTSMVTIVLCLCLIAGSTYALFTDKVETNITVSSGNVDIDAKIGEMKLYSIQGADPNDPSAFSHHDKNLDETFYYTVEQQQGNTFANGGDVGIDSGILKISRMTPGDKVEVEIKGANNSDVNIKVRCVLKLIEGDAEFVEGFNIVINDKTVKFNNEGNFFASDWTTMTVNDRTLETQKISVELPVEANNDYKQQSFRFVISIEAVQDNAVAD